jgi:hypothetical protein
MLVLFTVMDVDRADGRPLLTSGTFYRVHRDQLGDMLHCRAEADALGLARGACLRRIRGSSGRSRSLRQALRFLSSGTVHRRPAASQRARRADARTSAGRFGQGQDDGDGARAVRRSDPRRGLVCHQ